MIGVPFLRRVQQDRLAANSLHLYFDIGWFGILTGSTLSFLAIYAARIGSSSFQIGMINGVQAIVNLAIALPAGFLLARWSVHKFVFWSAVSQRIFYGILILIPLIFSKSFEMNVILVTTFIMSIPGTALSIGANALFADAVPVGFRGRVAGIRNAVLSVTTIASTLICGQILTSVIFPINYQIVFGIGFLGAVMSTLHLWFVKPVFQEDQIKEKIQKATGKVGLLSGWLRSDVLIGGFGRKIGLLFLFHTVQYLGIAIFPIYQVNILHLTDSIISIGNGIFYILMFLVSVRLVKLTARFGYKNVLGVGIVVLTFYPAILSLSHEPYLFYAACVMGGTAWGLAGGALYNYILESAPPGGRAGFLSWYNLVFNAGILIGSLGGPFLGSLTNYNTALWIVSAGRLVAGLALLIWG